VPFLGPCGGLQYAVVEYFRNVLGVSDAHLARLDISTLVFTGCNFPNCPRASVYDGSERDYRVVMVSDAISGVASHHLDEARRIGVVPLPAETLLDEFRLVRPAKADLSPAV
jgi:Isochorismatase family